MDTAKYKALLEEELKKTKTELASIADPDIGDHVPGEYATKFPNYGDDHDTELLEYSPSEVEEYEKNLSVTDTFEKKLNSITKALQKIADGTYGRCEKCGQEIDPKRLEVSPAAATCVQCADK